jgi:hypothetical protein
MFTTEHLTIEASPVEDLILKEATTPDHDLNKQNCCGVILGKNVAAAGIFVTNLLY